MTTYDSLPVPTNSDSPWPIRTKLSFCILAAVALATRRLDHLIVPQFYAEDASKFFLEAETLGWGSLFLPVGSYLNLGARAVSCLSAPLPWTWLPLVYSVASIFITVGIAFRILVARIPKAAAVTGALAMIAIPSQGEVFLNICCLHFVFAGLIMVNLLEPPPRTEREAFRRTAELMLGALSGPEMVVLLPLSGLRGWAWRNNRAALFCLSGFLIACLVQCAVIFSGSRASVENAAPSAQLLPLYTTRLFYAWLEVSEPSAWLVSGLVVLGFLVLFRWSRDRFSAAVLIAVAIGYLMAGRAVNTGWPNPFGNGSRYTYIPYVFVVWAIGWLFSGITNWKIKSIALIFFAAIGTSSALHWIGPIPPNHDWPKQVREAQQGERTEFAIPGPHTWYVPVPRVESVRD